MENSTLILEGLSNLELLSLTEALSKEEGLKWKNLSGDEKSQREELGKHHEFISATILAIGITNVALRILKLWWDIRKRRPAVIATIILPDKTEVRFEKGEVKPEDSSIKKLDAFSDTINAVQDLLKSLNDEED